VPCPPRAGAARAPWPRASGTEPSPVTRELSLDPGALPVLLPQGGRAMGHGDHCHPLGLVLGLLGEGGGCCNLAPSHAPCSGLGAAGTNPDLLFASLQAVTPCSPAVNYEPVSEPSSP